MHRFALIIALPILASAIPANEPPAAPGTAFLAQGWSDAERETYYYLPQGSEVMPYSWFLALEQSTNSEPFRDPANIESFRFIPNAAGKTNPDGLPVGFAKGRGQDGQDWFGLTCAACHTGQFTYKGKAVRVDGGATLADMIGFQSALVAALRSTVDHKGKFDRFAHKVLGDRHTLDTAATLAKKAREQLRAMGDWEGRNRPAHPSGYGTWDALNILLNTITATATGEPDNYRVPKTPVSYPSIWLTNRYDRLLWNASVENVMLRQVGEVIIVFGRATARINKTGPKFGSSADIKSLNEIYDFVYKLKSPKWPEEVLGAIDREKAKRGAMVYEREGCAKCHPLAPYPTTPAGPGGRDLIKVTATPIAEVGTDPLYAKYFVSRTATPASLAPLLDKTPFKDQPTVPAAVLFLAALTKITEADLDRAAKPPAQRAALLGDRPLPKLPRTPKEVDDLLKNVQVYKATPLAGVWATPPYLHNGSVPTLYDLLLPEEKRPKSFYVGSREFDPVKVGYRTEASPGLYLFDTSLPGFSNCGHTYGAGLSDEDRWALVEFLKSL